MSTKTISLSGLLCFSLVLPALGAMVDYSKHVPPEVFIFPTPREASYGKMDLDLTEAVIVIPAKASERVRLAAEDLNGHLLRLSPKAKPWRVVEGKVPDPAGVCILLGVAGSHAALDQALAAGSIYVREGEPGPEGYRISVRGQGSGIRVLLAGSDDQGAYWAMTSFVQLLRPQLDGRIMAHRAEVRDWPGFSIRMTAMQTEHKSWGDQMTGLGLALMAKTNVSCYSGYDTKLNQYYRQRGFRTGAGYWIFQGVGKQAGQMGLAPNHWSDPRVLQAWVDAYKNDATMNPGLVIYHDCTDAGWWNRYLTDYWQKRSEAEKKAYTEPHPARADADRVNAIYRGVKSVNADVDVYITAPCYYDSPQNNEVQNVAMFREYLQTLGRLTPGDIKWVLEDRSPEDCAGYRRYLGRTVVNYKYPSSDAGVEFWSTTFTAARDNAGYSDTFFYCVGHPYQSLMFAGGAEYMWNPSLPADYAYLTEQFIPRACKFLFGNAWREMAEFYINYQAPLNGLSEGRNIELLRSAKDKVNRCVELLKTAKEKCDPSLPAGKLCIEAIYGNYEPVGDWLPLRITISEATERARKAEILIAYGEMDQAKKTLQEAEGFFKQIKDDQLKKHGGFQKDFDAARSLCDKLKQTIATGKVSAENLNVVKLDGMWRMKPDPGNKGVAEKWFEPAADRADWQAIAVPGWWESSGISGMSNYDGYGWYHCTFKIPPAWKDKAVVIHFDAIDDEAWVYVNGQFVGDHTLKNIPQPVCWEQPFKFDITELIYRDGENSLVVRVNDVKLGGGIWKSAWFSAEAPSRPKEGPGLVEIKDTRKRESSTGK